MFSRRTTKTSKDSSLNDLNINYSEFIEAIKKNDFEKAKSYIPSLQLWKLKDENGFTPLHFSVFKNNYELSVIIIDEVKKGLGISTTKISNFINQKTNEGFTALHYACSNGNIEMVKLLKKYGAKFEETTNLGKNVIHLAAETNKVSMLIYLILNEGLDIFCLDDNGSTPLHWACYYGSYEVVNYLLVLNADVNARDKDNFTPLNLAVSYNKENIVRLLLLYGADKNVPNKKNEYPIDIAKNKHYSKIKELLEDKEYHPLCTLDFPIKYIEPTNVYKNLILIIIIVTELILFILVLPFLEEVYHMYANFTSFVLCLLSYIIFILKKPKYLKNTELIHECGGEDNNKPYKALLNNGVELEKYCPRCYIENKNNIQHCFICDKCVLEMSHHCFWFNRCICKENKIFYLLFIFFTFIYIFISIFNCSNLIFDTVTIPYIKSFLPSWLYLDIDRGFRVLGGAIVMVSSFLISFPLFFLFMIEMFKYCGLLGKKFKKKNEIINEIKIENAKINKDDIIKIDERDYEINNEKNFSENIIEEDVNEDPNSKEEIKEMNIIEQENNINNKNEDKSSVPIPQENFPLVDPRSSDVKQSF